MSLTSAWFGSSVPWAIRSLHVGDHARSVRGDGWTSSPDWTYWSSPLIELRGKTMGIVGLGRIGRRVAELASAFGMRVIASTRTPRADVSIETNLSVTSSPDPISSRCTAGLPPKIPAW